MKFFFTVQYGKFLLVGGSAAGLHWLARIGLGGLMSYEWSVILSYFVGLLVAFALNSYYVFPESQLSIKTQVSRFLVVNLCTMPAVWLVAIGLNHQLTFISDIWWRESVSHGVAVSIPAISSFIAYKLFAFK